jgi:hypothetical protein
MSTMRRHTHAVMCSFAAKWARAEDRRQNTQLAAYLTAYIVGALAAFGLIRLVHAPDWLSAVSIASSLVSGAVTSIIQKKLDIMSVPLGRIVAAILVGIATIILPTLIAYWHAEFTDIDARNHITATGNISMHPKQLAVFNVEVPSHRDYFTIKFAGTPSPGDDENCLNGANLLLAQDYGATVSDSSTRGFGTDYTIEVPPGVARFALSAVFVPQLGFETCTGDVTVTSAYFHN